MRFSEIPRRRNKRVDPAVRFMKYVSKTETCWEWVGSKFPKGYGQFQVDYKPGQAHRWAWIFFKGEIPVGLHVCHKCDNRSCVNPEHLFLGTNEDNHKDKVFKGRQARWNTGGGAKWDDTHALTVHTFYKIWTSKSVADALGMSPTTVRDIARGKSWKGILDG